MYKSKYLRKLERRDPPLEGVVETKAEQKEATHQDRLSQLGLAQQAAANQQLEQVRRMQQQQTRGDLISAFGAAAAAVAWPFSR